ncbi:MAG TPA: glycosyltransferase family 2 protein [Acidimicrobiia bacterium]
MTTGDPSDGHTVRPPALPDPGSGVGAGPAPGRVRAPEPEVPAVLALVVTHDPGVWFEETLASLARQDYPGMRVLVVDVGSREDPSARVHAQLPDATVRRLPGDAGFAAAANEALEVLVGVPFLLVCHDDVALDPGAVRLLVEEAYRSNAGVVGPKLVSHDDPQVLLEVGRLIDRYGAPHTGIEPGELDQEQHDAVRDVFYVSSATMLVRADLFRELSGFDRATYPGAEDLDLCWRARLAGARVLVAPDARVRHRQAATERGPLDRATIRATARSRVRTVLSCYSFWTLVRVVPVGLVLAMSEAVVSIVTRRRGRARAALGAWWWNFRHLGTVRRRRRKVQSRRRISDSELRELQVRGSAQVRSYLSDHLHTEERLQTLGAAGRQAVDAASAGARQPVAIACVAVLVVLLVGSRDLISQGVPAVGSLARWPGMFELLDAYASGWRFTGMGSAAAAPPAFVAMAALATPVFGAVGLARTLLVVGAIPLGALGAYRVARPIVGGAAPAAVTAVAYAVNPVPRNAIAVGRLGPLVLFALGPFLVAMVLRVAGGHVRSYTRLYLALVVVTAVTMAFFGLTPVWLLAAAVAMLLASPVVGGALPALRMVIATVVASVGAVMLLFPWPLEFVGADRAAFGFLFRPDLSLSDVLRFQTGPSGAGWAAWGLLAAAVLALAIATGARLAWAARAWMMALVGFAGAWLPARFAPDEWVPAPEAALSLAALGVALAIGVGVAALVEGDLRQFRFGWRQPVVAVAGIGMVAALFAFAADAADGRWHAPSEDWDQALGFLRAEESEGGFRVLWVGDSQVLPLDPVITPGGVGYVLTRDGPGDALGLYPAPEQDADRVVASAVDLVGDQRTSRIGHLVAPMGVRYVAMPSRSGPGAETVANPPAAVAAAFDDQTDLVRLGTDPGIVLYENIAWAPTRADVPEAEAADLPLDSGNPLRAAQRTDLTGAEPLRGPVTGSAPAAPGTVLWSEAFDDDWQARSGGERLDHVEPFGLVNGYVLAERGSVAITYEGQTRRYGMLAVQGALWIVVLVVWWVFRPHARDERTRRR